MNKQEFLTDLAAKLSDLPADEIEERVTFYSEMIDDRMEEGLTEEEAVAAIGCAETSSPPPKGTNPTSHAPVSGKLKAGEIVLIAAGFPLWLSL